jgi:hypothetical protein
MTECGGAALTERMDMNVFGVVRGSIGTVGMRAGIFMDSAVGRTVNLGLMNFKLLMMTGGRAIFVAGCVLVRADAIREAIATSHKSARYAAIAGVVGVCAAAPVQAQMPAPFENVAHIVCIDQNIAIELLAVLEDGNDRGEKLLAHLAARGMCERTTFSGKPVADVYPRNARHTGQLRKGHVFEVDVTSGQVLKGRTRAYMLLYVMHDNEA